MDELLIRPNGTPVCHAHYQPGIDHECEVAAPWHYDAWLQTHGTAMRCQVCQECTDDTDGHHVVADFLTANRASWGDRTRAPGPDCCDLARCFESYLRHPSNG